MLFIQESASENVVWKKGGHLSRPQYVNPNIYVITSPIKCWIKLLIHSQTSTMQQLKPGNGLIISFHFLLSMEVPIHAGINVDPC